MKALSEQLMVKLKRKLKLKQNVLDLHFHHNMFKDKNLSPKQLALLTALLMSSLIALSVFMLIANWKLLLAYFIACFIVIYLLVNQILEFFTSNLPSLIKMYRFSLMSKTFSSSLIN